MSEVDTARRLLASVEAAIAAAERLMESEDQDVRVFALDTFTKLAEIELTLLTALGVRPQIDDDRNPLARRARLS